MCLLLLLWLLWWMWRGIVVWWRDWWWRWPWLVLDEGLGMAVKEVTDAGQRTGGDEEGRMAD